MVIVRSVDKFKDRFKGERGVQNCKVVRYADNKFDDTLQSFEPELVIHLASFLTSKSDKDTILTLNESNILFGNLLLNEINYNRLKWFINVGSFSEYHNNDHVLCPTY